MNTIILQQAQSPPFSTAEQDVVIVTHDTGKPQLIKTDAVIVMPDVVTLGSYQSQIDNITSQLSAGQPVTLPEATEDFNNI